MFTLYYKNLALTLQREKLACDLINVIAKEDKFVELPDIAGIEDAELELFFRIVFFEEKTGVYIDRDKFAKLSNFLVCKLGEDFIRKHFEITVLSVVNLPEYYFLWEDVFEILYTRQRSISTLQELFR